MSEPMPSWAQALIESNLAVSQALQEQAKSQQALAEAIVQLVESQVDDSGSSVTGGFVDGALG